VVVKNTVTSKFFGQDMAIFFNLKNPFVGFANPFFCCQVVKIRPKKNCSHMIKSIPKRRLRKLAN
jgi:hypothetical protein